MCCGSSFRSHARGESKIGVALKESYKRSVAVDIRLRTWSTAGRLSCRSVILNADSVFQGSHQSGARFQNATAVAVFEHMPGGCRNSSRRPSCFSVSCSTSGKAGTVISPVKFAATLTAGVSACQLRQARSKSHASFQTP